MDYHGKAASILPLILTRVLFYITSDEHSSRVSWNVQVVMPRERRKRNGRIVRKNKRKNVNEYSDRIEASSLVKCRSYGAANATINIKRGPGASFKEVFHLVQGSQRPLKKALTGQWTHTGVWIETLLKLMFRNVDDPSSRLTRILNESMYLREIFTSPTEHRGQIGKTRNQCGGSREFFALTFGIKYETRVHAPLLTHLAQGSNFPFH